MQGFENIDWAGMAVKVGIAIIILLVTWILARIVRWAVSKLVSRIDYLQRPGANGKQLGESIGQIASLIVWLLGLVAILNVFALQQVLEPLNEMLGGIFGALPNIIGAAFIFFIGFVIAKIVRQLVETALGQVDFSRITSRLRGETPMTQRTAAAGTAAAGPATGTAATGTSPAAPGAGTAPGAATADPLEGQEQNRKIVAIVGNLVFAVIVIVVAIAALQVLGIAAISEPAQQMLQMFLNAIPVIIGAAILIAIGGLIATFAGNLLEQLLRGFGTDRAAERFGIVPAGTSLSTIITRIVQVAIWVFFAIMATRMLGFPEVTNILNEVLELGGRVLFGGIIIAAGFLIASIIGRLISDGLASKVLRYATIALFAAMGLKYMGIADSIINLAFGAVVVGGALAAALAFGLGGREAAARTLNKVEHAAERADTPAKDVPPTGATIT